MQPSDPEVPSPASRSRRTVVGGVKMSSMRVTGELAMDEDLYLAGEVLGRVTMGDHMLTVTTTGRIEGDVHAKTVVVLGEVRGDIVASLRVALGDGARVTGKLTSPRIAIAPGAIFNGAVDMQLGDEYWNRRRTGAGTKGGGAVPAAQRTISVGTSAPAK